MVVSEHALERFIERFPGTSNWSRERKILKILEAYKDGVVESFNQDMSQHVAGKIRLSVVKTLPITLVSKYNTILTVY